MISWKLLWAFPVISNSKHLLKRDWQAVFPGDSWSRTQASLNPFPGETAFMGTFLGSFIPPKHLFHKPSLEYYKGRQPRSQTWHQNTQASVHGIGSEPDKTEVSTVARVPAPEHLVCPAPSRISVKLARGVHCLSEFPHGIYWISWSRFGSTVFFCLKIKSTQGHEVIVFDKSGPHVPWDPSVSLISVT